MSARYYALQAPPLRLCTHHGDRLRNLAAVYHLFLLNFSNLSKEYFYLYNGVYRYLHIHLAAVADFLFDFVPSSVNIEKKKGEKREKWFLLSIVFLCRFERESIDIP